MHFDADSFAGHGGFYMSQQNDSYGSSAKKNSNSATSQYDDNGAQNRGKANTSSSALRPCTIRQLLCGAQQVGDGALILDGHELGQVSIVGRVLSIGGDDGTISTSSPSYEEAAAHLISGDVHSRKMNASSGGVAKMFSMVLTDGTGSMICKKWLDAGEIAKEEWNPGHYVRILGSVKIWQESPQITGTIRAMIDTNEMTYHFLDCVFTHLRLTCPAPAVTKITPGGGSMPNSSSLNTSLGRNDAASLDDTIRSVASLCNKRIGVTWEDVYRAVMPSGRWTAEEVQQGCYRLLKEGYLMTTSDEKHFVC